MVAMTADTYASLPLWAISVMALAVAIGSAVAITALVRRILPKALLGTESATAAAVFNVAGTTYAVLLAFVAMLAWEGYNHAKVVTDTEASLVQNVYDLVAGLTGPEMPQMRADIEGYADEVVHTEWPAQAHGRPIPETDARLDRLTRTALGLRPDNIADGDLHMLLLGDLTRLGSARRERLLAAETPIPAILWVVLICGGAITVVCAALLGSSSLATHLTLSALLAVSGALVLLVIVALSNPYRGDLRIEARPFEQVLVRMRK
jgi:hypothetical protein